MKRTLLSLALLLTSQSAFASTDVAGVPVPNAITLYEQTMQLNGAGVRSKFFIDLYVGSLFSTQKTSQAQQILTSDQANAIRLNITSDMITSDKMIEAMNDGFKLATKGNTHAIENQIAQFIGAFSEPIKSGDQFTLLSIPGKGIVTYKNGKQLAVTSGEEFRRAVLAVWLGDKPTDKKLKKRMLKG
ncbi:chalcone isomerase family protein [Shewanella intestini]|uniref:Chalcone isomerase n=1 Tax=Shewanella intestini TaxID=2017544 RepID=A0ABS5I3M5_9GAMM|nr:MULTISPECIES: chalcone isomerase family protein [Shewanella]MBR9728418.1 chalcone isomerase [Shewanella intestini]MRG36760.1 chalcone isomerase [Shewanella sp. XMDDZSB0408]